MKVNADALGNLAYKIGAAAINDDFGNAGYSQARPDDDCLIACDEIEFAVQLKRALAQRKKRITIDVAYPKS